jgi:hypothetical protein
MIIVNCTSTPGRTERQMAEALQSAPGLLLVEYRVAGTRRGVRETDGVAITPAGIVTVEAKNSPVPGILTPVLNGPWKVDGQPVDFNGESNPSVQARKQAQMLAQLLTTNGFTGFVSSVVAVATATCPPVTLPGAEQVVADMAHLPEAVAVLAGTATVIGVDEVAQIMKILGCECPSTEELLAAGFPRTATRVRPRSSVELEHQRSREQQARNQAADDLDRAQRDWEIAGRVIGEMQAELDTLRAGTKAGQEKFDRLVAVNDAHAARRFTVASVQYGILAMVLGVLLGPPVALMLAGVVIAAVTAWRRARRKGTELRTLKPVAWAAWAVARAPMAVSVAAVGHAVGAGGEMTVPGLFFGGAVAFICAGLQAASKPPAENTYDRKHWPDRGAAEGHRAQQMKNTAKRVRQVEQVIAEHRPSLNLPAARGMSAIDFETRARQRRQAVDKAREEITRARAENAQRHADALLPQMYDKDVAWHWESAGAWRRADWWDVVDQAKPLARRAGGAMTFEDVIGCYSTHLTVADGPAPVLVVEAAPGELVELVFIGDGTEVRLLARCSNPQCGTAVTGKDRVIDAVTLFTAASNHPGTCPAHG